MQQLASKMQGYMMVRVLVGLLGVTLSVVLHELFHIVMHLGRITHIDFFPTLWTVVKIDAAIPEGYDLDGEEVAAYGITVLVILITTIIIFKIKDSEDTRSSGQILFPHDKEMQKLNPAQLLKLSDIEDTVAPAPATPPIRRKGKSKSPN